VLPSARQGERRVRNLAHRLKDDRMVTPGDSGGKTCTRRTAAARLVYRIWVDAPEDLRQRRGVERYRETHRQLWLDWMKVERQFFAED
jgi:hypothetical protein